MNQYHFQGRVAIVTGGATGIGKGISSALAKNGAAVAIVNRRLELAEELVAELAAAGLSAKAYPADVANGDQVDAMVKAVLADFGRVDILVNNAGVRQDGLLLRMRSDAWDSVLTINLKGAFHCIKSISPAMMKARHGRIISVSSVVGLMGNAGQANYAAAKAGLFGLTKSAARELAPRNITVNAVAPGYVATDMTSNLSEEQKKRFLANVPLGRVGTPGDIAGAICFLASDDAGYITGQTLTVDGGMVM